MNRRKITNPGLWATGLVMCTSAVFAVDPTTSIIVNGPNGPGIESYLGGTRYTVGENQGFRPGGNSGINLLQSFDTFQLNSADTVLFTADPGLTTENIIGKVTGGDVSNIYGRIEMNVTGANLFLLNPAGFVFGPGATLAVDGSFHASTDSDLWMEDPGGNMITAFSGDSALQMAHPAAFGFLAAPMGKITVEGATLQASKGLSLLASEIDLQAGTYLYSIGGSIDVGASTISLDQSRIEAYVNGSGDPASISLISLGNTSSSQLSLQNNSTISTRIYGTAPASGDLTITGFNHVVLNGANTTINTDTNGGRGGSILLDGIDTLTLSDQAQIRSDATGSSALAGNITVNTRLLTLSERAEISTGAFESANTSDPGYTPGGVTISADEIHLTSGGSIESISVDAGNGGDISIDTRILTADGVYIPPNYTPNNSASAALVQPSGVSTTIGFNQQSSGGNIYINMGGGAAPAESIQLTNGGRIGAEAVGGGIGGEIHIRAADLLVSGINQELAAILPLDNIDLGTGTSVQLQVSRGDDFARSAIAADAIFAQDSFGGIQTGQAGAIYLDIDNLQVSEGARIATFSDVSQGNAGDISISAAQRISVTSGGEITSQSLNDNAGLQPGTSDAGDISLNADSILLSGGSILASTISGEGGSVNLQTNEMRLEAGGAINATTTGSGSAGSVTGFVDNLVLDNSQLTVSTSSDGSGGNIDLSGSQLTLRNNSQMNATSSGTGDAGSIRLATGDIVIHNSGIYASTEGSGNGGNIDISGDSLTMGSEISATTSGSGNAGSITIDISGTTLLDDSHISASTTSTGAGGDILLNSGNLYLRNDASIEVLSLGTGNAGNIDINVANQMQLADSRIASAADQAFGGDININSDGYIHLYQSSVTTSVTAGAGSGGNITLAAPLVALNQANIIARADAGNGGNIAISADQFFPTPDTIIDASANTGIDGEVVTTTPDTLLEQSLATLSASFLDATALIRPGCDVAGAAESEGSLVVSLRRGLPASPEELLASFDSDWQSPDNSDDSLLLAMADTPQTRGISSTVESAQSAFRSGNYSDAEAHYAALSELPESQQNHQLQASALRGLGESQHAQGEYGQALMTLRGALAAAQNNGDAKQQAEILGSLGNTLIALGERQEAENFLQRGIVLAKDTGNPELAAGLTTNLGNAYAASNNWNDALSNYEQSAQLALAATAPGPAAQALSSAARAAYQSGQSQRSLQLADQARELVQDSTKASGTSKALVTLSIHLAKTYEKLASDPATREYKPALRNAFQLLNAALQQANALGDNRDVSLVLGNLAALYRLEQRHNEALYLTRKALASAEQADAPDIIYRWHWQIGQIQADQGHMQEAIASYRKSVKLLEETRQEAMARYGSTDLHFKQAVAPVYQDLVRALLTVSDRTPQQASTSGLLHEARSTVELLKAAELRDYFQNECIAELATRRQELDQVADDVAIVYPVILADRIELLVSIGGEIQHYPVAATAAELEETARHLRRRLQDPRSKDYLADAQQLYRWLIQPWIANADKANVATMVFVPDGALRSLPMAVLHDGQHYLVENYALAVTPSLDLIDPKPLNTGNVRLLAVGVSEAVNGFSALANVPAELEAVHNSFGGQVFLNDQFSVARVEKAIADQRPNIVHIASHGVFSGDPDSSYLLAYDGHLTMNRLAEAVSVAQFRDDSLELLMLSACQTAAGDDRAALGLAGVAIRAGARSAVGSLWSISDEAAYRLVVDFYQALSVEGTSKAEALRTAQRHLIEDPALSHPFFWSPFLLISNWL
ncbi:CHAT domain-containing protein [Pseudomaricurvus sp. HS19]|uniref:CHAT domain-containing protein n=1 Tax=Pseudomaricurvus sp. HS19 TaxID=2692626 RepID=UPI00136C13C7|nr:CHAT domain-containing protein [Pseudomaricurvus sp. HS19]MYM62680.1 CHAT domain-containing protein [Pseudomaricurvus sp. HS19]